MMLLSISCVAQIDDLQRDYFRAQNYMLHNQTDSAIMLWKQHSDVIEFAECLTDYFIDNEQYSKALLCCRDLEKINSAEADFRFARIYAGMGFAEESVAYLEKHFAGNNKRTYTEILRCNEFENINRTAEWREFWNTPRYSKLEESFADIEYQISSGKYDYAIEMLDEMSSAKPARHNYLYAKAYSGLENYCQAEKYINLAMQSNSKDAKILSLCTEIQKNAGKYSDAYETCKKLFFADRYNAEVLLDFADICVLNKKNAEAKIYTGRYLQCFPDNEKALFMDAKLAVSADYSYEALVELSKLIELNSSNSEYFKMRGEAYYGFEMWNQAFYDFSMALDITPDDARLNYLMGMCKYNMASYEKACYYWRRAATGKSREAAEMYYRYCEAIEN